MTVRFLFLLLALIVSSGYPPSFAVGSGTCMHKASALVRCLCTALRCPPVLILSAPHNGLPALPPLTALTAQADTRCLVGLCASNATVLLTLHPSAQAGSFHPRWQFADVPSAAFAQHKPHSADAHSRLLAEHDTSFTSGGIVEKDI